MLFLWRLTHPPVLICEVVGAASAGSEGEVSGKVCGVEPPNCQVVLHVTPLPAEPGDPAVSGADAAGEGGRRCQGTNYRRWELIFCLEKQLRIEFVSE